MITSNYQVNFAEERDTSPVRIDRIMTKLRNLWQENPEADFYNMMRLIAYRQRRGGNMPDQYLEALLDKAIEDHTLDDPLGWEKLHTRDWLR